MPTNVYSAFLKAMNDAGLYPSDLGAIVADGQLHRIHLEGDKPGTLNGWYVLHADGVPAGGFGCWKRGINHTWCAKGWQDLTPRERKALASKLESARRKAQAEREHQQKEGLSLALRIWESAVPANPHHPYLVKKGISKGRARQYRGWLILPIVGFDGAFRGFQSISPDGKKRLSKGTVKKGSYIPIGGDIAPLPERPHRVMICEGWATGRTLAASAPDALVLAAIDAGNLKAVAVQARRRWPDIPLVIACDFDKVGLEKGYQAARAVGGLILPPPGEKPEWATDWNDIALWKRQRKVEER